MPKGAQSPASTARNKTRARKVPPRPVRRWLSGGVVGAILLLAAAPVMASSLQLPVIVEAATDEHHAGKVVFIELITPDIASARQFYAGLFGWTFRDVPASGIKYTQAYLDGRPVGALVQREIPPGERRQPAWLTFIAVRDVDAAAKVALEHGGKVLFGPRDAPARGREAVLADPQGAVFAVLASSSGDPPDTLARPGDWIWTSLITRDPEGDAAFYQEIFDYEVFDLPAASGAQHLMLASDNYARASVNSLPVTGPAVHPYWLNFVRVQDTARMTARAVALGGRVLVEPRPDRHGGKVAVVADPQGAPFGLLEWPDSESKEQTR